MEATTPSFSLPEMLKTDLVKCLEELDELRQNIAEKGTLITEKTNEIKQKVDQVQKLKHFKENERITAVFEKTAQDYSALIANTLQEIDGYVTHYGKYLNESIPKELSDTFKENAPILFASHVAHENKILKRYIKKRKKDFSVFFSRYDHGYTVNMQRLQVLEHHLRRSS